MPCKHKAVPLEERFAFIGDDELEDKRQKLQNKNTTKAHIKSE